MENIDPKKKKEEEKKRIRNLTKRRNKDLYERKKILKQLNSKNRKFKSMYSLLKTIQEEFNINIHKDTMKNFIKKDSNIKRLVGLLITKEIIIHS